MPDLDANHIGYAKAFQDYFDKGWRGILPLRHGSKWPPPKNFTGYGNPDPSYADIMSWANDDLFAGGNLGLRLPDGVIGIDVDEYGAKNGARTFAEAIARWGPLPPAPRTTSRIGNPISGIRLFAVPLGTMLATKMEFPELHLGDVEIIQPHHRYAMSWPSVHPEGGTYWWRNDDDQIIGIPELGELPLLPQAWLDGLKVVHESNLEFAPIDVRSAWTDGTPSPIVQRRLAQAFIELNMPGCSRHDTCTRHVMALMRYGKSGEPGVAYALEQLCKVLIAIRAADGTGDEAKTKAEVKRMITGDNIARELAKPGINDWFDALIVEDLQDDDRQAPENPQAGERQPPKLEPPSSVPTQHTELGVVPSPAGPGTEGNSMAPSDNEGRAIDRTRPHSPLEEIEQGFWESRESLAMIYQTAMAQMASPWAVLAICAARALTQVRPHVTLPPLIGGPGSLNWFAALVARSGGGKGAAGAAANVLIPRDGFEQRNLGSGEGLVRLFDRPKDDDGTAGMHEALLINVDEVSILTSLSQRTGSTTSSVLCSAFSGETLGFSYVNRANVKDVKDYRMTLVVSVQPKRAGPLLADEGGGLPQRFMWFPAKDVRVTEDDRWPSGQLTLPRPGEWLYPRTIAIPQEAKSTIKRERAKNQRDEEDAMDGHALFAREKFAYALTVLDGRIEMTLEDWELSSIAAEVSTHTRETCRESLREAARIDALDRGEIRGIENHAADDAKEFETSEKIRRLLRGTLRHLEAAGEDGMSDRDLSRATAHRDRRWLPAALQIGQSNGLLRQLDSTKTWVKI